MKDKKVFESDPNYLEAFRSLCSHLPDMAERWGLVGVKIVLYNTKSGKSKLTITSGYVDGVLVEPDNKKIVLDGIIDPTEIDHDQ